MNWRSVRMRFWLLVMDVFAAAHRLVHKGYLFAVERAGACVEYDDDGHDVANPPF